LSFRKKENHEEKLLFMGALILWILALLISFYLLNEVTDRFFVPSLDKIAHRWNMSDDAAGATLMAAGSSAPELFIAIISLIYGGDHFEIGVGTIVGSALFNLLVIIGAVGLVKTAKIAWRPMSRDIFFYLIAIALLYWAYSSGAITLLHVGIFVLVYVIYVLAVIFWKRILPGGEDIVVQDDDDEPEPPWKKYFRLLDYILDKLFAKEKYYGINFFISVILIALLSWVLVESAVVISQELGVPKYIIALTILAFGTSVPDMMSSIIVAKQGRGGMAISNALGSNIFDVLIGLGLPWLILIFFQDHAMDVDSKNIAHHILVLLGSVVGMLSLFVFSRWRINRWVGSMMILSYIVYLFYVAYTTYYIA
jgi:K+-dependent Na+/Ca+ exchanger-like protein